MFLRIFSIPYQISLAYFAEYDKNCELRMCAGEDCKLLTIFILMTEYIRIVKSGEQ